MDFSLNNNNNKYSNAYTKSNIKVNYIALYNKFKITFIFFYITYFLYIFFLKYNKYLKG